MKALSWFIHPHVGVLYDFLSSEGHKIREFLNCLYRKSVGDTEFYFIKNREKKTQIQIF